MRNHLQTALLAALVGGAALALTACGHSGPPATSFDTGTYTVGEDIAPGKYVAAGGSPKCIWAISMNGADIKGSVKGHADRAVGLVDGVQIVTAYCGEWTLVS